MDIALAIIAVILVLVGIVGAVFPGIPGPPFSYIGLLLVYFTSWGDFSTRFMIVWAVITVVVTVVDYYLPVWMTRKFGGSRYATIGSVMGIIAGIFFWPPFGLIVFPFLGALAGELIHDNTDSAKAFKVAFGSFVAFIAGTGAKLIVSAVMAWYVIKTLVVALF